MRRRRRQEAEALCLRAMRIRQATVGEDHPFTAVLLNNLATLHFEDGAFEEAEPQLRSYLFQQRTEAEYVKWLDTLRGQTHIERKGSFGG